MFFVAMHFQAATATCSEHAANMHVFGPDSAAILFLRQFVGSFPFFVAMTTPVKEEPHTPDAKRRCLDEQLRESKEEPPHSSPAHAELPRPEGGQATVPTARLDEQPAATARPSG